MIAIPSTKTKQYILLPVFTFFLSLFITHSFGQGSLVSGKVTNATGEPVPSASVVIKGTRTGTSTDNNGNFSLNVANRNATLIITSSGYDMQEVPLNGRTNIEVGLATV